MHRRKAIEDVGKGPSASQSAEDAFTLVDVGREKQGSANDACPSMVSIDDESKKVSTILM
jgi:hypothetical protein